MRSSSAISLSLVYFLLIRHIASPHDSNIIWRFGAITHPNSSLVFKFVYHSHGCSAPLASPATYLVSKKQAQPRPLTLQESDEAYNDICPPLFLPSKPVSLTQMSHDVTSQMQCSAPIICLFKWREVLALYKISTSFSLDFGTSILSSDFEGFNNGLISQNPIIWIINVFKSYSEVSFWSPKLSTDNNLGGAFEPILWPADTLIPIGSSMGGLEKPLNVGVPANQFLDINSNQERNETLIGRFSIDGFVAVMKILPYYLSNLFVPFYATYDEMVAAVMNKSFDAVVGDTSIVVNRRNYVEFSLPYSDSGVVMEVSEEQARKGWRVRGLRKPLIVGVPARGAFHQFVKVMFDQERNKTLIDGFSVQVFREVVKQLPYHLRYLVVPFYGTYNEMVVAVSNKSLDAAVGDTDILANRYEYAEFSQPYIPDSGLVMVVTEKPTLKTPYFTVIKAFKLKLWILLVVMSMSTGVVIWLNEYVNDNPDFRGSFPQLIGSMLWFSITVLSFSQRESIKSNLSRLVLTTWLFVVIVATACFSAVLPSIMTVPRVQPSVLDVDYLLTTNASVGCNGNSFIVQYLVNHLHFKPENIKKVSSIDDYPKAFEKGDISAAFFVAPHSKVFLAKYCKGYTKAGPVFETGGGFGFVFPKGSPLTDDISEAILKVAQSGEINRLEQQMLISSNCSSSSVKEEGPGLGPELFSGPLLISGIICGTVLLISTARLLSRHWLYLSSKIASTTNIAFRWTFLLLAQSYKRLRLRFFRDCGTGIDQRSNNQQNGGTIEVV